MATGKIQLKRGTDASKNTPTLAQGEPFYATDTKKFYIGHGDGTETAFGKMLDVALLNLGIYRMVPTGPSTVFDDLKNSWASLPIGTRQVICADANGNQITGINHGAIYHKTSNTYGIILGLHWSTIYIHALTNGTWSSRTI